MREPDPARKVFALVAEFATPDALVAAAERARKAGFTRFETYSPFPIEALNAPLGFRGQAVRLAGLIGGIVGAAVGYGLQVYTNLDFPLNSGGRPVVAPPAFMLVTFELTVLGAVTATVLTMLLLNNLPRLHHPMFETEGFARATSDAFFLAIQSNDPKFDPARTRAFLRRLDPVRVEAAPFAEEPE